MASGAVVVGVLAAVVAAVLGAVVVTSEPGPGGNRVLNRQLATVATCKLSRYVGNKTRPITWGAVCSQWLTRPHVLGPGSKTIKKQPWHGLFFGDFVIFSAVQQSVSTIVNTGLNAAEKLVKLVYVHLLQSLVVWLR